MGEYKGPERVDPSSLLQGGEKSLGRLTGPEMLTMIELSRPSWHGQAINAIKARGRVPGAQVRQNVVQAGDIQVPVRRKAYVTGARVQYTETGKKLTVIKASVGRTKKGRILHRVADTQGNVWDISEKKLKLL